MELHLFEGQTCLQIIITISCNTGARGWSPVTEEINGCRLFVCLFGYCMYIILGNVKLSKRKEINISPVLTHYTTHELIVADERGLFTVPSGGQISDDHLCDAALMNANFPAPPLYLFIFFSISNICDWTSGHLSSQAGTDKTGVILPPSSSSSKNDKWKYSGLLIVCFYGITSLQQVRL